MKIKLTDQTILLKSIQSNSRLADHRPSHQLKESPRTASRIAERRTD